MGFGLQSRIKQVWQLCVIDVGYKVVKVRQLRIMDFWFAKPYKTDLATLRYQLVVCKVVLYKFGNFALLICNSQSRFIQIRQSELRGHLESTHKNRL